MRFSVSSLADKLMALVGSRGNAAASVSSNGEVTSVGEDGTVYVALDGSSAETPASTTVEVQEGDRVSVTVSGHRARVVGNLTSPAIGSSSLDTYATAEELAAALSSYLSDDDLAAALADYVAAADLSTALESYATIAYTDASVSSAVSAALYDGDGNALYASTSSVEQLADSITSTVTTAIDAELYDGDGNALYATTEAVSSIIRQTSDGVEVAKLVDGAYTTTRTLIDDTGLHVLDGEGSELSTFESDSVELCEGAFSLLASASRTAQSADVTTDEVEDDAEEGSSFSTMSVSTNSYTRAYASLGSELVDSDGSTAAESAIGFSAAEGGSYLLLTADVSGSGGNFLLEEDKGTLSFGDSTYVAFTEQGITAKSGDTAFVHESSKNSDYAVGFGVGGGGTNRGIYDRHEGRWIVHAKSGGGTYLQGADGLYLATSQGNKRMRYIDCGSVTVSGGSGSVTSADVSFNVTFTARPYVFATANATAPGAISGVAVSDRTTTGCTVYLVRSSSTSTTVMWLAVGYVE